MKSPSVLLYGETYAAMRTSIQILDKVDLSEEEIDYIKGVLTDASFLSANAYNDQMFGFMDRYSTLKNKWDRRNNV